MFLNMGCNENQIKTKKVRKIKKNFKIKRSMEFLIFERVTLGTSTSIVTFKYTIYSRNSKSSA